METKEIIESLRYCASNSYVDCCVMSVAAERLEELEEISENWCNLNDENMELLRKYREDITELKQQLSEKPEWISVEDRLPENGAKVLGVNRKTGKVNSYTFFDHGVIKEAVSHWMFFPKPPKPTEPTFKDIFLKRFPGAVVLPKSGAPVVCAKQVFPQLGDDESPCDMCCAVCWNQPYFETEEEGGE